MAGLSVYIAVAHSVIHLAFWGHSLQPELREWRRVGGVGLGKERDLFGRGGKKRNGERESKIMGGGGWKGEGNSLHSLLWSVIRRALLFE